MDFLTPTLPYNAWLQQQFPYLLRPMQGFSFLGSEIFYLAMLPLIYWAMNRPLGARLGALLLFSVVVNEIFKVGFALPRPYWIDSRLALGGEPTFGFPSGHAQGAWLLWPYLALKSQNRRLWLPLAVVLAFCITISRNFLGVHFLADSIGGTLIGLTILLCAVKGGPAWMRFWRQLSTFQKIVFSVVATLFLAGIYAIAMYRGATPYLAGYGIWKGQQYHQAIQSALAGGQIASRLGAFCGLLVGAALLARFSELEIKVPLPTLAIRFTLGFAGLAACYLGLKYVLPSGIFWNFLRYGATTLWVAFGAPWAFRKLSGAQKRRVA